MIQNYTARLTDAFRAELACAEFARILDCIRWAERHGPPADCVDIYSATGRRTAQYRKPRPGSYAADCGVWVNAKIY